MMQSMEDWPLYFRAAVLVIVKSYHGASDRKVISLERLLPVFIIYEAPPTGLAEVHIIIVSDSWAEY